MIFFMRASLNAGARRAITLMSHLAVFADPGLGMTNGRISSILEAKWLVGF
jgi:hypothetical protein